MVVHMLIVYKNLISVSDQRTVLNHQKVLTATSSPVLENMIFITKIVPLYSSKFLHYNFNTSPSLMYSITSICVSKNLNGSYIISAKQMTCLGIVCRLSSMYIYNKIYIISLIAELESTFYYPSSSN